MNPESSKKIINILHISDLHITSGSSVSTYRAQLETDLTEELKIKPGDLDFLVISGDIGSFAKESEYVAAYDLVNGLLEYYKLGPDKLVIVPGNHDVDYHLSESAYRIIMRKNETKNLTEGKYISSEDGGARLRDENHYCKRFNTFNDHFYKKLLGKEYPQNYEKQVEWVEHKENRILFVGFNSAWEIDHHYEDRAKICREALSNVIKKIHRSNYTNWLKIAIWHHPVTGRESMDSDFLEQLVTNGFKLCLHGHIHEAKKENFKYDIRDIHIVAAGTFGAPAKNQKTGIPLQYNLLTYDTGKKEFEVKTRKKEKLDGAWSGDARWGDDKNHPQSFYKFVISEKSSNAKINNSHDYCQHAHPLDEILPEKIENGVEDTSDLFYIPLTLISHDAKPFKEARDLFRKFRTDPEFNLGKNFSVYSTIGSSEFMVVMRLTDDSIYRKVVGQLKDLPLGNPMYRGNKVEVIDVATEYRIKSRSKCCAVIPTITQNQDKAERTFRAFIEIRDIEGKSVYKKLIDVITEYEDVVVGIGVNKLHDHMMVELFLSCGHFSKLFNLTKQLDVQDGQFHKQTFLAYYSDDNNRY